MAAPAWHVNYVIRTKPSRLFLKKITALKKYLTPSVRLDSLLNVITITIHCGPNGFTVEANMAHRIVFALKKSVGVIDMHFIVFTVAFHKKLHT